MTEAVIVAAVRSPIGRAFKGSMTDVRPDDLTATVVEAAMAKVPQLSPGEIDDVHLGCGLPGGEQGFNMARVVCSLLGWEEVPGTTITRYCASSLQTTRMAFHAIKAGEGDAFVSAGVETVSRFVRGNSDSHPDTMNPVYARSRERTERMATDGATSWEPQDPADIYIPMGQTAENLALRMNVSREAMDDFAFESQRRYAEAEVRGFWENEILPLQLPDGRWLTSDESPRTPDREKMRELQPVFRPGGRVTAGNACPLNDGAAAVIVMSDRKASDLGIEPLARIVATGVSALDPEIMGFGPVAASKQALDRAGMSIRDMDIVELNEAFAAQVLPSADALGVDHERLNPQGGSIAVGHPFGMTGARITCTLLNGLQQRDGTLGLETMCVGGGQGMAMIVERLT